MAKRFIAFDVETPNFNNDRMSAIGVTVLEDGEITDSFYTLIDPETWFSQFNSELTGIYPEDVADAPTFPEVWEIIRPMMEGGILAAHNAPFDMSVLARCLNSYRIEWKNTVPYVCTCSMARALFKDMENHKLNTLCSRFDIPLDHHNAGSDSTACAMLLQIYAAMGADPESRAKLYSISEIKTLNVKIR